MRYAHFTSSEKKMPPGQPSEGNEVAVASAEQSAMPKAEARDLAALNTDIWTPSEPVVHRPPPPPHRPPFTYNHQPPQVGSTVKHYELLRQLGEGAMGTVYLARDTTLGRLVAIKVLRIHTGPSAERFLIEAQATARCRHDNIVVIHEVDNIHGYPYMVLEYLEGRTLREWMALRDRPAAPEPPPEDKRSPVLVSPSLAVELMLPVVRALSCAHQLGIVHRDLKPENIFLTDAGRVVVLDFGIAKRLDASELSEVHASARPPETSAGLTQKGALLGTLPYMSPEQLRSEDIDPRSDLWTVGIILYELVTGAHPRPRRSLLESAQLGDSDEPMPDVRDRRPDVGALGAIIDRCLHKQRDERYRSADELLAALEALALDGKATELGEDERPFAGLFAFQETDAVKFFGRSHEIAEVVTQVRDRPLLAVAGSSGVGKSSFVRAGVIPALKRSGEPWETLILRPGRKPMEAIASMIQPVVAPASNLADDVEEHRKLVETLRREPGHLGHVLRLRTRRETRRLLLFVDQFEELYTQVSDPAERAAFTACLSAVADDATSPLRVVLAMRSDFLDRAAEDRRFIGALTKGLFFLGRPDRERLREAIENPAEMAGYRFELPSIVDDMLAHLEATPGALPLLQFTAAKLWDMRDRRRRLLTHATYTAMGGVAGALASHADRVMSDVGAEKVPLARAILLRLVTAERTRAIVPLAELRALSREDGDVSWLIDQMVDARLLIVQTLEGGKGTTVEIVHESLVHGWPALRRWLDENQDDAALLDQLRTAARQWAAKNRDPGLLWRGDALAEYQRWRGRHAASLTPLEAAFGAASAAEAARGRRIRNVIVALAIVTTAVFVIALTRANLAANHAKHEAEGLLRDSYFEQGRLRVLDGDRLGALAPLATAYRMGSTGPATRLLLEEAARPARGRLLTLEGHTDKLWDVAYSPDGKWLATASSDNTARIWDAQTGALRTTVRTADRVITVAFSPDSRLMASGGQDHTVRVWDVIAGREVMALPVGMGIRRVAFSPDGTVLLTAAVQGAVKLWRMPSGTPLGELGGHAAIMGATFCDNGACIVTWDTEKIVVWDAVTLARRTSYQQSGGVFAAAVSRTGALIAIGTESGELVLLRGDGSLIARRAAHDAPIFDIAISPDETVVATGSNDRTVRLWSAAAEPRGVLAGHRANITRVRFTPAGDRLVTTSADNTARLWSAAGMLLGELTGHTNMIMMAAVRSDGGRLATASWDHTVMVWDLARAEEFHPIVTARDASPPIVAFDPSGDRLAVARADGALSVVDVRTGTVACTAASATPIKQMAWTGSAQIAALGSGGQAVELWNARRCTQESTLPHPAPITAMSARSGPRLATAAGNVVRVWSRGRLETSLAGYTGSIQKVDIDGDDLYAITNAPATIVVDAIGDPARRRIFRAGTKPISDVRFDREQNWVVAASWDQFLYIWDAATGALVRKLEGNGPLDAVRTSPDGSITIGVGGFSPTVWDLASGARKRQLEGHSAPVQDGQFLNDQIFVSIAWNHTAFVWDVATARQLMAFQDVDAMVFADDLRSVAIIGATGVRLWSPRLPPLDLDAVRALHLK
jgi:WD40 repeat protein/serine/threonine protein kinase